MTILRFLLIETIHHISDARQLTRRGVALYVNPELAFKEVIAKDNIYSLHNCDCISILINPGNCQHLISLVYRPPWALIMKCRNLVNKLSNVGEQSPYCTWTILSDFNLPNVKYDVSVGHCKNGIYNILFDFFI